MSTPIERPVTDSVNFFDQQFRSQIMRSDYALNPFEQVILPHLSGDVLDLGCGLGNLALAAASRGCRVLALDASASAVGDLSRRAHEDRLPIEAYAADLRHYVPARRYDCVVSVGLLMFLACSDARALLGRLREAVRGGGIVAVNVLVEGTTYMDMFDPQAHCLFQRDELQRAFSGWETLLARADTFDAPAGTVKRFETVVMRMPLSA